MPTYIYQTIPSNNKESIQFEIVQSMKDAPLTHHPETGEPVKRIIAGGLGFSVIGKTDPFSVAQFRERTGRAKGTLGDLFDRSKEMSEMRASKIGTDDPVKQKYYADFEKKRRGTPHPAKLAENQKKAKKDLDNALKSLGLSSATV